MLPVDEHRFGIFFALLGDYRQSLLSSVEPYKTKLYRAEPVKQLARLGTVQLINSASFHTRLCIRLAVYVFLSGVAKQIAAKGRPPIEICLDTFLNIPDLHLN